MSNWRLTRWCLIHTVKPGLYWKIISFCWNRFAPGLVLGCAIFVLPYSIAAVPVALLVKLEQKPVTKTVKKRSRRRKQGLKSSTPLKS